MYIYFLFIRLAALLGHKKAQLMVIGQRSIEMTGTRLTVLGKEVPHHAIWIHAASVGEFEQARPLIERIRRYRPQEKIVVTFFSPSGYEMRKNYPLADAVLYLPFATRRNAKAFIEALQPQMAIFVKYEFWPAYLHELKRRDIPTYSISAIFRPGQLFFQWFGKWHLELLRCFTYIYVQDESSLDLLHRHGIPQAGIAGDTRFDRVHDVMEGLKADNERLAPVTLFTEGCERVIVAGSTWPKDEELLAHYCHEYKDRFQDKPAKMIIVPHEIDEAHLHFLFNLFKGRIVRYSQVYNQPIGIQQHLLSYANVMVIDTMGLLSSIYRFGQVAYIGGGFGVGIHNTIEAAVYGMPVIFGPNYQHFREAKGLIAVGAGRSIRQYAELEIAFDTALEQHETIGAKAAEYVQSELGATDKIYKEIFEN